MTRKIIGVLIWFVALYLVISLCTSNDRMTKEFDLSPIQTAQLIRGTNASLHPDIIAGSYEIFTAQPYALTMVDWKNGVVLQGKTETGQWHQYTLPAPTGLTQSIKTFKMADNHLTMTFNKDWGLAIGLSFFALLALGLIGLGVFFIT